MTKEKCGSLERVPEAFVEVTVYSNEGPCSFVGRRQRALYRNVMQENYGTMASFGGFPIHSSELLSRLDRGEEAWVPDLQSSDESADEGPVKPTLKRLPKGRTWWDRYQSPVSYPSSDSTNSGSEQESEGEQEKSQRAGHRLTILHRNLLDNSRGNGSYSLKPREICKIGPQLKKPPRSQLGKVKSNLTEFGDVNESTAKEKAAGEEHEYPCPHCVQAFKSKLSLSNHKRIHSREGAYKCSSCGERFTALKALASHQRSHAGERGYKHPSDGMKHQRVDPRKGPYQCPDCKKCFKVKDHLLLHQKSHTAERPHKCPECGKSFIRKEHLSRHQKSHLKLPSNEHPKNEKDARVESSPKVLDEKKPSRTPVSEQTISLDTMSIGHQGIDISLYKCQFCGKCMRSKCLLIDHERIHREQRRYKCSQCKKSFCYNYLLLAHTSQSTCKPPKKMKRSSAKRSPSNSRTFRKAKHSSKVQTGQKIVTHNSRLTQRRRSRMAEKLYECQYCGKFLSTSGILADHEKLHTGQRPYKCHECEESFIRKHHLIRHQETHTRQKPIKCSKHVRRLMRRHLTAPETIHTGLKPYGGLSRACTITRKSYLDKQEELNAEDKLFKCQYCGKRTTTKSAFVNHGKIHRRGKKPYKCLKCGKAFFWKNELTSHEKSHLRKKLPKCSDSDKKITPQNRSSSLQHGHKRKLPCLCLKCGKSFDSNYSFTRHQRIHTPQKRFKCAVCGKGFVQTWHLKRHEGIHVKEKSHKQPIVVEVNHQRTRWKKKPFKCTVCGKRCSHMWHFDKHKKTHLKEECEKESIVAELNHVFSSFTNGISSEEKDQEDPVICKTEECGALDVREKTKPLTSPSTPESNTQQGCRRIQVANELQNAALQNLGTAAIGQQPEAQLTPSGTAGKPILQSCREESGCVEPHTTHSPKKKVVASQHRSVKTQAKYGCKQCKKSFINKRNLLVHKKSHVGNRSFPCTQCEKSFCAVQSLNVHMRIHMGKKSFKCSECEFSCNVSSNLTRHKRTHSQGRPHPCLQCGKSFWFSHSLAAHLGTHSKNETYLCSDCGRTFKHKNLLKLHRRYKHDSEAAELAHSNEEPSSGEH
ncbi:zinc finger protein 528-like [Elgaria multicarinata webbii]|uniref:zinc finger protein 528-like n=1 Tax=Elgaria multicarinata webbii TaxID=159646 RepID=UPI002FCD3986